MFRTIPHRSALAAIGLLAVAAGCSQEPVTVPLRSLEPGGDISFLCLSTDGEPSGSSQQVCGQQVNPDTGRHDSLYALLTQPVRGELAVVDLSAGRVVDFDESKPGYNFVPIGAHPGAIVSTPGSTATFVSSSQAGHEGIWIIPSKVMMNQRPLHLTSFAECALPSAPEDMKVMVVPADEKDLPPEDSQAHPNGDVSRESTPRGARKLLVSLPDDSALVVIDAQALVDMKPGTFPACPIEKWLPLTADLPPVTPRQAVPQGGYPPGIGVDGAVCDMSQQQERTSPAITEVRPGNIALDEQSSLVYLSDESAPVIHVVDVSNPAEATEIEPLLPVSADDPWREVTTSRLAVSPTTTDGKKFLYAIDLHRGSVMTFDVSESSTNRTPLIHDFPTLRPFEPRDRLSFAVPVRDVTFVTLDDPVKDPKTGVLTTGLTCDPEHDSSLAASYRTADDRSSGAGPSKLRGVFAVVALTNGQFVVVDVDDFDAPCRRQKTSGSCATEKFGDYHGASGEFSCLTVERHEARNSFYFQATGDAKGRVPGLQSYPVLSYNGTVLLNDQSSDGKVNPRMLPPDAPEIPIIVGNHVVSDQVSPDPTEATNNAVVFDYREPRVHFEQDWRVEYEGSIPGFDGHFGRLVPDGAAHRFIDGGGNFCSHGVHDLDATRRTGEQLGIVNTEQNPKLLETWARDHVDVLEITSDFLAEEDPYWDSVAGRCSWRQCRNTYGLVDSPKPTRDFPIIEARQDRLLIEGDVDYLTCCFPTMPSYTVRPQMQWTVTGSVSGFLHKVDVDPSTGRCVDSCDPQKSLLNGRAFTVAEGSSIPNFGDPRTFRNPAIRFVIWKKLDSSGLDDTRRGSVFTFRETGGFAPLMINLAAVSPFVAPQQMRLVPSTGEIAVADGSNQGLVFLDLTSLSVSRSYQ